VCMCVYVCVCMCVCVCVCMCVCVCVCVCVPSPSSSTKRSLSQRSAASQSWRSLRVKRLEGTGPLDPDPDPVWGSVPHRLGSRPVGRGTCRSKSSGSVRSRLGGGGAHLVLEARAEHQVVVGHLHAAGHADQLGLPVDGHHLPGHHGNAGTQRQLGQVSGAVGVTAGGGGGGGGALKGAGRRF